MFCIHSGMAARAASRPAMRRSTAAVVVSKALREDFNLHLLHPDVVGYVFRGHGQAITPRSELAGNQDLASACSFVRIPTETDRRSSFKLRQQRARTGRSLDLHVNGLALPHLLLPQNDLDGRRLACAHE